MLRWLLRLLVLGLIAAVVIRAVVQVLNREDDFDDFDDLDAGLDFVETPVEIDVPAEDNSATLAASMKTTTTASVAETDTNAEESAEPAGEASVIDVKGIGPTYAARLRDIGINTLHDLVKADPDDVQEKLDVAGGSATVQNWIEQARELTSGEQPTSQGAQ
jgi:predicted flap endonuclease-1-like 5' DNA nuclease